MFERPGLIIQEVAIINESVKLLEIATVRAGHPFRGSVTHDDEGDVNVVQVKDTDVTGRVDYLSVTKTVLTTKKQPDWLKNGDVLFVSKGVKHYSVFAEDVPEQTVCSPHFFVVRLKPEAHNLIMPEFLCWQLNQLPAQRYFMTTAEGSMYLSIRRQVLENVPVKILPPEKQKQLTGLFRKAVREQELLQQLIENRQKQLEAIAMQALGSVA
ncbi:restriction endonuclease subunit S [Planctobacterium marinum]|uniref:restriction endonuclease subunit S n=1 Tax=Planctobacterium marinum TaxID=1631968 RepID=UPI001E3C6812|nr:restriction endonuclease subunit S [Planctobacterium marinum]MCC2607927.1 restriction endonuclease subunit S [Planctobacterium marinum]